MRWAVEIENTGLEERNIADLLGRIGFTVVQTAKPPAFTSERINGCATAAEAFEVAKEVRAAMTGAAEIDKDFQLGSVVDFSTDPPKRHAFLEVHCAMHFVTSHQATLTISPPKGLSDEQKREWEEARQERDYQGRLEAQLAKLVPAFVNPNAEKVLALLAEKDHTGESLFRIYELMAGVPRGRQKFNENLGVSQSEFKRFSDAVHNAAATGDWARHPYHEPLRGQQPMTPAEAESFVRALAMKWLASLRKPAG